MSEERPDEQGQIPGEPQLAQSAAGDGKAKNLCVVGVGTSAGGIQAVSALLEAMPNEPGLSLVIIQHLEPHHQSHLEEILGRKTPMPVRDAQQGMPVEANHVYICPPNKLLEIHGGKLVLKPLPEDRLKRRPVDVFLHSLADDCGEWAVAVILTGAGSNGSAGIAHIREHGGLVLVQDPDEAEHPGMPQHAIATGMVDLVGKIRDIPALLTGYAENVPFIQVPASEPADDQWTHLNAMLALLRARTGQEFRCYKKPTLVRRTLRRMALRRIQGIDKYTEVLRNQPDELSALADDLLIGVTGFFREPEAWQVLREKVIAPMMRDRPADAPVRAWVPACATGQEAYTLAILLRQEAEAAGCASDIKVFATDPSTQRLDRARGGIYPDSIAVELPADILSRWFEKLEDTYRVSPAIRQMITFAPQNLITDPPFSGLDLVTCRNLLIYLEPETQKRVLALFHFALRESGHLMLGNTETVSHPAELFEPVDRKWRIFRRIGPTRHDLVEFPIYGKGRNLHELQDLTQRRGRKTSVGEAVNRALAERYGPAAVVVDRQMQVVYFHGATDRFLVQPTGDRTNNLLDMARQGLRGKLSAVVTEAFAHGRRVVDEDARVRSDEGWTQVALTAVAMVGQPDAPLVLVTLRPIDAAAPKSQAPLPPEIPADVDAAVGTLEEELRHTRNELESTIRELERSIEDYRAANEEITSVNEELQSTNEEMETGKEELQSLNEELSTVNHQLQAKLEELETANNDMRNLLASTDVGTVFLDRDLRIKWFSPAIKDLLSVLSTDIDRPIQDFSPKFHDPQLLGDLEQVLRTLAPAMAEVYTSNGQWYLRRVTPYRTSNDQVQGVVITFSEITAIKRAQEQERRLATVVRDSNDAILLADLSGQVLSLNRAAEEMYGWRQEEAVGRKICEFAPAEKRDETAKVVERLVRDTTIRSFETQRQTREGKVLTVWVTVSLLYDEQGKAYAFATTERDVTEIRQAQQRLREFNQVLEQRVVERTALAEERARQLQAMALELVRADEQKHRQLAQVLHDDLQQILAGARFTLRRMQGETSQETKNAVTADVDRLLGEALQCTQSLTHELSPPILREAGLLPALDWIVRWSLDKHGLRIDVQADPQAEPASEEVRYLLFSACREMLFNIVKHAGVDQARIELRRQEDAIELTVADEGQGCDPRTVDQARGKGGFGLMSIRQRVESLGGQLQIDSAPGQGCRVSVSLPDLPPMPKAQIEPTAAVATGLEIRTPPAAAPASESTAIRVLLADDHAVVRQGLTLLLRQKPGIEVVGEAANGVEAVEKARQLRPDVILMDFSMPNMNGVEATRVIHTELPTTRIIGLSMYGEADRAAAMLEAGAIAYVSKTGKADVLMDTIRQGNVAPSP